VEHDLIKNSDHHSLIKVYAFPFAGGNRYSYNVFRQYLSEKIDFTPVEIPGRGRRINEPLLRNIHSIVDDIYERIAPELTALYAIYGHSMGGLIGYLLIKKLQEKNEILPTHLIVSGSKSPSSRNLQRTPTYRLPANDFINKIKELNGSPTEILENKTSWNIFEPILRADFEAVETFCYQETKPFNIPITVMMGLQDEIAEDDMRSWQRETVAPIALKKFNGNHFFIFEHAPSVTAIIEKALFNVNTMISSKQL